MPNLFTLIPSLLALAFTLTGPNAASAADVMLDGKVVLSITDQHVVTLPEHSSVQAYGLDEKLLAFVDRKGHLYAVDVEPRADGTLPAPHPSLIMDLSQRLSDLTEFTTPLVGFMPADQANENFPAGDLIIALDDGGFKSLVTKIDREKILDEIDCGRLMSHR